MLKNNNQEIVRKIAFRSMKQNRIRNGIVILAVILTTFMFTTIFTIGASMAEGMMVMLTRQQGTRSSIYLNNPTTEQIQQIMIFMLLGCKFRPEQHTIRKMKPLQFCLVITMRLNLKRISRLPSAIFVAIIQQIPPQLCFLKMHWKPCKLKRQK